MLYYYSYIDSLSIEICYTDWLPKVDSVKPLFITFREDIPEAMKLEESPLSISLVTKLIVLDVILVSLAIYGLLTC